MGKFNFRIASLATALFAAAFIVGLAYGATDGTRRPSVSHSNGSAVPVEGYHQDAGGNPVYSVYSIPDLIVSATPTVVSTPAWIDTLGYTDLVIDVQMNGGSATVYVETSSTVTGSSVPGSTYNGTVTNTILTSGITNVTYLGKFTRIRLATNTSDKFATCATVSIGCVFRSF